MASKSAMSNVREVEYVLEFVRIRVNIDYSIDLLAESVGISKGEICSDSFMWR